ncbi:beta-propeller fold lactonase family protein [Streptomyces sp. 900105245]
MSDVIYVATDRLMNLEETSGGIRSFTAIDTTGNGGTLFSIYLGPTNSTGSPLSMAKTPDGSVYIPIPDYNSVSACEVNKKELQKLQRGETLQLTSPLVDVRTFRIDGVPLAAATSPNGEFVYILSSGLQFISVIDANSQKIIGRIFNVGSFCRQLEVSPNGESLYALGSQGLQVIKIDESYLQRLSQEKSSSGADSAMISKISSLNAEIQKVDVAEVTKWTRALAVSQNGLLYLVNAASSTVTVLHANEPLAPATTIQVENGPVAIAVSRDGALVCTANRVAGTLSMIDAQTNDVTSISVGGDPQAVKISHDGRLAYTANYESASVSIVDLVEKKLLSTIDLDGHAAGLALLEDRASIG